MRGIRVRAVRRLGVGRRDSRLHEDLDERRVRHLDAALDGERRPQPLVATAAAEFGPEFSPDGKWIAYISREVGRATSMSSRIRVPGRNAA